MPNDKPKHPIKKPDDPQDTLSNQIRNKAKSGFPLTDKAKSGFQPPDKSQATGIITAQAMGIIKAQAIDIIQAEKEALSRISKHDIFFKTAFKILFSGKGAVHSLGLLPCRGKAV